MAASNITVSGGNVVLKQGTTAQLQYVLKDSGGSAINVSGWDARMQVRKSVDAAAALLSKNVSAGGITVDAANGKFTVLFSATDTSSIRFTGAELEGVYDVEVIDAQGNVTRIAEGSFTVTREVTR